MARIENTVRLTANGILYLMRPGLIRYRIHEI